METTSPKSVRGMKIALLSVAAGICLISAGWVLAQSNLMEVEGDLNVSGDANIDNNLDVGEDDVTQGHVDLYGDATTAGGRINIHNSGNEDDAVPFYQLTADGTNLQLNGLSSSDLTLRLSNSGSGDTGIRMDGEAAIGTTNTPSARLEVRSAGTATDVANLCDSGGNKLMQLREGGGGNAVFNLYESNGTTHFVHLQPDADSYYTGSGQFGIGTIIPSVRLDVESGESADGVDINNTAANGDPQLRFQLSGASKFTLGVDDSDSDKFKIGTTSVATGTRLVIDGDGDVGIGTTNPAKKLHVNGVIALDPVGSAPTCVAGAMLYVLSEEDDQLFVKNSGNTETQLSSHKDPRDVVPDASTSFGDLSVALPFSFHHSNNFIGKGAVVDLTAAVKELETLTNKSFTYGYYLPEEEILDPLEWQAETMATLELNAKHEILAQEPEVEIPISEAWELIEAMVAVDTIKSSTRYVYDLESEQVTLLTFEEEAVEWVGTGVYERRLKPGVRFDETTGKFYRERTLDEIEIEPIPPPELPEWVAMRLP